MIITILAILPIIKIYFYRRCRHILGHGFHRPNEVSGSRMVSLDMAPEYHPQPGQVEFEAIGEIPQVEETWAYWDTESWFPVKILGLNIRWLMVSNG